MTPFYWLDAAPAEGFTVLHGAAQCLRASVCVSVFNEGRMAAKFGSLRAAPPYAVQAWQTAWLEGYDSYVLGDVKANGREV